MLIIEQAALPNGAHRSQYKEGAFLQIPEGWFPVMPSIEAEAMGYLPFIVIDEMDRGWITAVSQGTIPEPEPEPEPEPAPEYVTYEELAAAIREGVNSVE